MITKELVSEILTCIDAVKKILEQGKKDVLEAFRTRAREAPSIIFANGLAYTIVYMASRSSAEAVELGLSLRQNTCKGEALSNLLNNLLNKYMGKEKLSYALYISLLSYFLNRATPMDASEFAAFVDRSLKDPTLERTALDISEWMKRIAEALISPIPPE
ncbi:MAG: type III-B CRISPR module-associated protein Cmr5 [Candidatus Nezhaarchaeales archaeon]